MRRRTPNPLLHFFLLSLFALVPASLAAQEVDPNEVIRVNTDLVVLDAQVIDRPRQRRKAYFVT